MVTGFMSVYVHILNIESGTGIVSDYIDASGEVSKVYLSAINLVFTDLPTVTIFITY
jgi:hypothetical protein